MSAPKVSVTWSELKTLSSNDGSRMKYESESEEVGSRHYLVFTQDLAVSYEVELREGESGFDDADLIDFVTNFKNDANQRTQALIGATNINVAPVIGVQQLDAANAILPAGIGTPFNASTLKLRKIDNDISFYKTNWTSIYQRSGSGVWLKSSILTNTSDFYIRILIDETDELTGIEGARSDYHNDVGWSGGGGSSGKYYIGQAYVSFKDKIAHMDYTLGGGKGLKYESSMEIFIKRDSNSSSSKRVKRLRLWEVEIS